MAQPDTLDTGADPEATPNKRARIKEVSEGAGGLPGAPFLTPPNCASIPHLDEDALAESTVRSSAEKAEFVGGQNCRPGKTDACDERESISLLLEKEAHGYDIASDRNIKKRTDYISWDEYFMAVAFLSAKRSKDPNTQQGACIVDSDQRVVGIGYNGFPRGCSDDCLPWAAPPSKDSDRGEDFKVLHTRDPYMCHAEVNAILNKCSADVSGAKMYCAHFPCNSCAKVIIQSRIREVIYVEDSDPGSNASRASRVMFEMAGVKLTQYTPSKSSLHVDFWSDVSQEEPRDKEEPTDVVGKGVESAGGDDRERERNRALLMKEAQYDPFKATVSKRSGYLSWDSYFMAVSFLSAQRSKDPNTQVGACIVDKNKCIVGIGYNGFPRGCSDDYLPWARKADSGLHVKYPYVVHAEVNAILNKCSADVKNATLYVALFPCNDCAKVIIQAGIREVVYLNDQYHDTDQCRASRIMFQMSGVKLRCFRPENRRISVDFRQK